MDRSDHMPAGGSSGNRPAIVLVAASFAALGAGLALPGALLPVLMGELGAGPVEAGTMLAAQPVAYLVTVLVAAWTIERVGLGPALSVGVGLFALGTGGFGLVSGWMAGGAALFVGGLGVALLEVSGNALTVLAAGERPNSVLNLVHLFFGLGAFAAPALSTRAVAAGHSWRLPFLVGGVIMAMIAIGWRLVAVPAPRPSAASDETPPRGPTFLLALLMALYVGVETGIGAWMTEYMTARRGLPLAEAGTCLALYWLSVAAGRLVLGVVPHRMREERLLVGLSLFAVAALGVALASPGAGGARLGFALTGLGFSGIFPAIMALGGRYGGAATARTTSILVAGAALGNMAIPWIMAAIVGRAGLGAGMGFYVTTASLMVALAAGLPRTSRSL